MLKKLIISTIVIFNLSLLFANESYNEMMQELISTLPEDQKSAVLETYKHTMENITVEERKMLEDSFNEMTVEEKEKITNKLKAFIYQNGTK